MKKTIIIVLMILLLSGCNEETIIQEELSSEDSVHMVSSETTMLEDNEYELSLVGFGESGALADDNLSIVDMLAYAIQDEYLAHDEYELIISEYGDITPYSNIINAELNHIDLLEQLYDIYDLDFPVLDTTNYVVLPGSLLEAAQTGVTAEINNIEMYEIFLEHELPDNIREVFEELMDGSVKHLASFNKQVDKYQ